MIRKDFIDAVKRHALANWHGEGWDVVYESYTDEHIAELIEGCRTANGAITRVRGRLGCSDVKAV